MSQLHLNEVEELPRNGPFEPSSEAPVEGRFPNAVYAHSLFLTLLFLVAAIAVPNYGITIQRRRQKRTMGDMRNLGTAIESYAVDHNLYPVSAAQNTPDICLGPSMGTLSAIADKLRPTYIKDVPMVDGWNSWFTYQTANGGKDYCLRSNGRDGLAERVSGGVTTTSFDADIVFCDGQFCQYPEGGAY